MGSSLKYVKEFEFPSDAGYTGSCGKTSVKGYSRGGNVMKKAEGGMVDPAPQKLFVSSPKAAAPAVVAPPAATGRVKRGGPSRDMSEKIERTMARNERVAENRPHKSDRLMAMNAALSKAAPTKDGIEAARKSTQAQFSPKKNGRPANTPNAGGPGGGRGGSPVPLKRVLPAGAVATSPLGKAKGGKVPGMTKSARGGVPAHSSKPMFGKK